MHIEQHVYTDCPIDSRFCLLEIGMELVNGARCRAALRAVAESDVNRPLDKDVRQEARSDKRPPVWLSARTERGICNVTLRI